MIIDERRFKRYSKMKKTFCVILGFVMILSLASSIMAIAPAFNIRLAQKNPADWSVVEGGSGNAILSHGDRVKGIIRKMEPNTKYTLIYYGYGANNDVWPYATCISNTTTNKHGSARFLTKNFDYSGFVTDGNSDATNKQKFWVILSSDVDCENHMMTAWNPTEYLFEQKTI